MSTRLLAISFFAAVVAFASNAKPSADFLDFQLPPAAKRFGIVQAQELADAQRITLYGLCGASVFKEKKGRVWIFETKIGYAGLPRPDIAVVEPPFVLPCFDPGSVSNPLNANFSHSERSEDSMLSLGK
jgi:hypothetical protein